MKALVIYDSTGRIWSIVYGEETIPQGLTCAWVDIPDGAQLESMDVSDPKNPKPVFAYLPESDIGKLQREVKELQGQQNLYNRAAMFAAVSFTDEQALQVPDLYDKWSGDGMQYKMGVRVNYNGTLYKVLQDHTSQPDWTPDAAPSLFAKVLVADPEVIPEWEQPDSTNGYAKGDRVTHNGIIWESLVDNNVWEPGAVGTESLWKEVEAQ